MTEIIRDKLISLGVKFFVQSPTNQLFVILSNTTITQLSVNYKLEIMDKVDAEHTVVRICTSWATKEENVTAFLADVERALS